MATVKSSSNTFNREYQIWGGDDKESIKIRLSVPFDLAPERVKDILDDVVVALETERDLYLERSTGSRQTRFVPLTEAARTAVGGRD